MTTNWLPAAHAAVDAESHIRQQFSDSIIDNVNVWLNVHDNDLNIIYWNKVAEEISGYSREQVLGHTKVWEWLYPDEDYRKHSQTQAYGIVRQNKNLTHYERDILCANGERRTILWNSRSLKDEHGNIYGAITFGYDITDRKRAEEALKKAHDELAVLYDVASVASESIDLSAILKRSLDRVLPTMRSTKGTIHLWNERTKTLHLAAYRGLSSSAVADERGNSVILETIDNHWTERFARSVTVDMGATALIACYATEGRRLKEAAIAGTISLAETIGRTIREARARHDDVLAAIRDVTGGFEVFRGKIADVERRTVQGFARGEAVFEGIEDYQGKRMALHFQNENLMAMQDGEPLVSVPDLITVLDLETGQPITTESLRYGFRVAVLGIPCSPKWRTPEGLALVGPRYFGYDVDYAPVEERFGSQA